MGLENFIPSVWAADALIALNKALVYTQAGVVNRDYEGEIRQAGDSVRINMVGDVTISNYDKNTDLTFAELDSSQTVLIVDQKKAFSFRVDRVDEVQSKPKVRQQAMEKAATKMKDTIDQYMAALMGNGVASANQVTTFASPATDLATATKAYDYLVDLSVKLDENDVPSDGRWAVIPPWYHGILRKDSRFVSSGSPQAEDRLQNGVIGSAAGFTLLKSNNVPNTSATKYKIIAGHPMAVSFAEQLTEMRAVDLEKTFANGVKGLWVYGGKAIYPNYLAMLVANKP